MRHAVVMLVDLHVIVETDARFAPFGILISLRRQGAQRQLVQRSNCERREPGSFLKGRSLSAVSSSRIAMFSAKSEWKVRWRRRARIQRSTTCTATSTLALSKVIKCRLCGHHPQSVPDNPSFSSATWRGVRAGNAKTHLG